MSVVRHPFDNTEYLLQGDGTVLVRDLANGTEGVFEVGGRHLSGDLRWADIHMLRWANDTAGGSKAIAPDVK
ncbi:MAG TPA: hypothetical protein VGO87_07060 [Acidimicrobiia bacterium]|jgi:hypothetical protein